MTKPDMILWLSDARGVYIPRDFANSFIERDKHVSGVSAEDWAILEAGPDHEQYWDCWNKVEQNAVVTDNNGVKFRVYQNGDCWLIPEGMEYDEANDTFVWPSDDESEDEPYELVETVDGQWMVLVDGVQWGDGPRDASGCSSQTWPTREEARQAIENEEIAPC